MRLNPVLHRDFSKTFEMCHESLIHKPKNIHTVNKKKYSVQLFPYFTTKIPRGWCQCLAAELGGLVERQQGEGSCALFCLWSGTIQYLSATSKRKKKKLNLQKPKKRKSTPEESEGDYGLFENKDYMVFAKCQSPENNA